MSTPLPAGRADSLDAGIVPIQDGFETVRELRTFSTVPIIVLSGRSSLNPGVRCFEDALQLGADRSLRKPFLATDLLSLVGDLLRPASLGRVSAS